MDRFLKYTTQKEPALTASLLAAILLALISRFLDLSEDDLMILGPIALVVVGGLIRMGVFSPFTHAENVQAALMTPPPQE